MSRTEAQGYAAAFKALADPTRIQIVRLLEGAGQAGLCVCDVVTNFPLEQPTISYHLGVLRQAGLVSSRKRGQWVYYSLNQERLAQIKQFLG